jgi:hypothetical protein
LVFGSPLELKLVGNDGANTKRAWIKRRRTELQQQFPNCVIDLHKYEWIDQGRDGACSYASLLNIIHMVGMDQDFFRRPWSQLQSQLMRTWKTLKFQEGGKDCFAICSVLDRLKEHDTLKTLTPLNYVPVRSFGCGENYLNTMLWDTSATRQRYGMLPGFEAEFKSVPFVFETGNTLESLIDSGIPVQLNFRNHSRVLIGYNDEQAIFADSWDAWHVELADPSPSDPTDFREVYFGGGFSYCVKWHLYSWCKDFTFLMRPDGSPAPAAAKFAPAARAAASGGGGGGGAGAGTGGPASAGGATVKGKLKRKRP